MNEPDWKTAPEGATHYFPGTGEWYRVFTGSTLACVWIGRWSKSARYWDYRNRDCIPRPTTPSWSGEGLPPVGVVCEASVIGMDNWFKCTVLLHHPDKNGMAAVHDSVGNALLWTDEFRPIRTPEQIAADERIAAVDAMVKACPHPCSTSTRVDCASLYDKGYRLP